MSLDDAALLADRLHGGTDLHDSSPEHVGAGRPAASPRATKDVSRGPRGPSGEHPEGPGGHDPAARDARGEGVGTRREGLSAQLAGEPQGVGPASRVRARLPARVFWRTQRPAVRAPRPARRSAGPTYGPRRASHVKITRAGTSQGVADRGAEGLPAGRREGRRAEAQPWSAGGPAPDAAARAGTVGLRRRRPVRERAGGQFRPPSRARVRPGWPAGAGRAPGRGACRIVPPLSAIAPRESPRPPGRGTRRPTVRWTPRPCRRPCRRDPARAQPEIVVVPARQADRASASLEEPSSAVAVESPCARRPPRPTRMPVKLRLDEQRASSSTSPRRTPAPVAVPSKKLPGRPAQRHARTISAEDEVLAAAVQVAPGRACVALSTMRPTPAASEREGPAAGPAMDSLRRRPTRAAMRVYSWSAGSSSRLVLVALMLTPRSRAPRPGAASHGRGVARTS